MSGEKFRSPVRGCLSIKHFQEREKKSGFTQGEEKGGDQITRPMRAEVNPRPGDSGGNYKIKPAPAPEKKGQDQGDSRVVGDVSRSADGRVTNPTVTQSTNRLETFLRRARLRALHRGEGPGASLGN